MAKPRYGGRKQSSSLRIVYYVLFGVLALWFASSIILNTSPVELMKSSFSKLPKGTSGIDSTLLLHKDSLITELRFKLKACEGGDNFRRGVVIVEGETLNLRADPTLNSSILLRIPAHSEVDILYYDTQTLYLQGKAGRWCRIKYANSEGWVWGNFIQEI